MQISRDELLKRLMIADASFLTFSEKSLLQKKLDSFNILAVMSNNELSTIIGRSLARARWNGQKILKKAETAIQLINRLNIKWTFYGDAEYPAMLTEMKDPPYVIFYRGDLNCLKANCVSMVGTRRATYSARKAAFDFAKDAGDNGETVISGLAFGIDVASHKGALSGLSGKTVAVLPGGIDSIVPLSHTKTASGIIECGGAIVSEYTPGTPAVPFRFTQRNRIIAALSPATVVVQAPCGSGAMITASLALDYNRYVFFHEACFNEESKALDKLNEQKLNALALTGKEMEKKVRSKRLNSPWLYVEDGAPVIKSYAEYCQYKNDSFCTVNIKRNTEQLDLFS